MSDNKLKEAQNFFDQYAPLVPREELPLFHVTGGIGWINDPNGFSVYKGEYHLFYQYHPYSIQWTDALGARKDEGFYYLGAASRRARAGFGR